MRAPILILSALVLAGPAAADAAGRHPVVVELFTSQGCSSCPPADAVLNKLAADPNVIAITRPVTYWDNLGWKDTLAKPANTDLQRRYAAKGMAGGGVYTPQAVVQGRAGTVGGREAQVRSLVAQAGGIAEPALQIGAGADGGRTVKLGGAGAGEVVLVALKRAVDVSIGRGENSGRKVRYANVLVGERAIGMWKGGAQTIAVPAAALRQAGADRYALLVRQPGGGPVLAARYL